MMNYNKGLNVVGLLIIAILIGWFFIARSKECKPMPVATPAFEKLAIGGSLSCAIKYDEDANISNIKKEVTDYKLSGQWDNAIACVVNDAKKVLEQYTSPREQKLAVIFDIDDTLLSNWPIIYKLDFAYDKDRWKEWELSGQDEAIAATRDLYNFAKQRSFTLFLITGRRENERAATEANLRRVGIDGWKKIYFKPMNYDDHSAIAYKAQSRQEIIDQGYTIAANIGDQLSDLLGNPQAQANFKLSNPAYFVP